MPGKRFNRKKRSPAFRKKRKYKARPRTGKALSIRGAGRGIPDRLRNALKYQERLQVNPAGLTYSYAFNLNSLFDPNRTGTGHQPMYYDQMAALYNRYRVRAVSWDIIISGLNAPANVVICPVNGSSSPVSVADAAENPFAKERVVNAMAYGGGSVVRFKGYMPLSRILGESLEDDRDQATVGSSPSNIITLWLMFETLDGATSLSSLNAVVKFTYYSEWFDRITVTGS